MSILPLTAPFAMAINLFALPGGLTVEDVEYDKVGSRDVRTSLGPRTIEAAVDKAGLKRLENIFGGSAGDGDVLVYTREALYMTDLYGDGESPKQSFFQYAGDEYRVAGVDPWMDQCGFNVYLGKRHVKDT